MPKSLPPFCKPHSSPPAFLTVRGHSHHSHNGAASSLASAQRSALNGLPLHFSLSLWIRKTNTRFGLDICHIDVLLTSFLSMKTQSEAEDWGRPSPLTFSRRTYRSSKLLRENENGLRRLSCQKRLYYPHFPTRVSNFSGEVTLEFNQSDPLLWLVTK